MSKSKSKSNRKRRQSLNRKRKTRQSLDFNELEGRRMLAGTPGPDGDSNDQICEVMNSGRPIDGETVTGAIGNGFGAVDVDLFPIQISRTGVENTFTVEGTDSSDPLQPFLRLFNASGTEIANDGPAFGTGNFAEINHVFSSTGTFYLGVSADDNEDYNIVTGGNDSAGDNTGGYELTFEDSNDQIDEASNTLLDGSTSGNIDLPTDVDVFRWRGIEGQSIQFNATSSSLNTFVRVFDDGGTLINANDNGGNGTNSRLTVTFDDTDDFFVVVSSSTNQNYDVEDGTGDSTTATDTGSYALTANEVSLDTDDTIFNAINAGNLFTQGTQSVDGRIDTGLDVDLYRFEVGRVGSFVEIDLDTSTFGLNSRLRLFNASGVLLESNINSGAPGETGLPRESFIDRVLGPGVYFVGVSAEDNATYSAVTGLGDTDGNSTGDYTLQIQDRLHVDSLEDLSLGETFTANDNVNYLREAIEFANDEVGTQTITFQPSVFDFDDARIRLSGGFENGPALEITDSVVIEGLESRNVVVEGSANRVFTIDDGDDDTEIDVTIRGLTIRGGRAQGLFGTRFEGDGVRNSENLTLDNVLVTANGFAVGNGGSVGPTGGGIYHEIGSLTITSSDFTRNRARMGSGIFVASGNLDVINSRFLGNGNYQTSTTISFNGGGDLNIVNSSIINNEDTGVYIQDGTFKLSNSLIAGNSSDLLMGQRATMDPSSSNNLVNTNIGLVFGEGGDTLPTSPTIDAGSNALAVDANGFPLTTDQFGNARIRFGIVDIGAGESSFGGGFVVTTSSDSVNSLDSVTSLREAINFANVIPGEDTITFDTTVFTGGENNLIRLTQGELDITDDLNIDGSLVDDVVITGDADGNDTTLPGSYITDLSETFSSQLSDNSRVLDLNSFGLTLNNLTITGGRSPFASDGGGINGSSGSVSLTNSTVSGNLSSDKGGGIRTSSGDISLTNSTVSGNSSDDYGGGIYSRSGDISLTNSTLSGNSSRDDGGGIYARSGDVSLTNSTLSGNTSDSAGGGILSNSGLVSLTNSTVSGNTSDRSGGGVFSAGVVAITNSTIVENQARNDGGGIYIFNDPATIVNSIIAGNTADDDSPDLRPAPDQDSNINFSLIGDNAGTGLLESQAAANDGNLIGSSAGAGIIDPLLSPLGDNGGPTLTHALLAGSPAFDAGLNILAFDLTNGTSLTADQRGGAFDRIQFGTVDIGSFESSVALDLPGLVVTVNSDIVDGQDGETSLREAINFANLIPGEDTITFDTTVFTGGENNLIRLTQGELDVTDNLNIDGSLVGDVVITGDADGNDTTLPGSNITDLSATSISQSSDNSRVLYSSSFDLTLNNLTITGGRSSGFGDGGGISGTSGIISLTNSTVSGNRTSDDGGGISNSSGDIFLINSTVSGNSSFNDGGGVRTFSGDIFLNNSTVSGNSSGDEGGGIRSGGVTTITNSTIVENQTGGEGGGIFISSDPATISNSIIAGNTADDDNPDLRPAPGEDLNVRFSLIGDNSGTGLLESQAADNNGNVIGSSTGGGIIDPVLSPLDDNGGPTLTHALLTGSPAIDAGNNALALNIDNSVLTTDQRGGAFERIQFDRVDIGSFESSVDLDLPSLVVTINSDIVDDQDGETSLREAIDAANNTPGEDTITFDIGLTGQTITLDGSQIEVTDSVTIQGLGADQLTISGNDASRIFLFGSADDAIYTIADVTLTDGEVARGDEPNPQTGGAISLNSPGDTLIIERSVISSSAANGGGAVSVEGDGAELQISDSALINNEANFNGSAVLAAGSVTTTIVNSTVSGNRSLNNFSTLVVQASGTQSGELTLRNVTVNDSTGNGLRASVSSDATANITIGNSIVAGSSGPNVGLFGPGSSFTSLGNNIFDDASVTPVLDSDQVDTDPLLGPLGDNGGPTPTHALLSSSTAINRGNNAIANTAGLTTDQRGQNRIQFDTVDIGAVESDFDDVVATAPVITNIVRDEGGVLARPDLINTYAVTFDQDVNVMLDDLLIFNQTTGFGFFADSLSYDSSSRTATWDLGSLSLSAAFYTFELSDDISAVAGGLSLDGDGDGTAGGLRDDEVYVAIPGDANLDGQVNVLGDAFALVANLGTNGGATWAQGDFNGDGNVNVLGDAFVLVANLNRDVRPPATATSFANSATAQFQSGPTASSSLVTTSSQLEQDSSFDDDDDSVSKSNPAAAQLKSPQLVLAGNHDLRDDIFGSDF